MMMMIMILLLSIIFFFCFHILYIILYGSAENARRRLPINYYDIIIVPSSYSIRLLCMFDPVDSPAPLRCIQRSSSVVTVAGVRLHVYVIAERKKTDPGAEEFRAQEGMTCIMYRSYGYAREKSSITFANNYINMRTQVRRVQSARNRYPPEVHPRTRIQRRPNK